MEQYAGCPNGSPEKGEKAESEGATREKEKEQAITMENMTMKERNLGRETVKDFKKGQQRQPVRLVPGR